MTEPTTTHAIKKWVRTLDAHEVLFREGDVDRQVYVLIAGRVRIEKNGQKLAEIDVAESFIGEVAGLTGRPRSATAVTVVPSTLLIVDEIEDFFVADPTWGLRLAKVLASRLDRMNERFRRLRDLLEETRKRLADDADLEAMTMTVEIKRPDE